MSASPGGNYSGRFEPDQDSRILLGTARSHSVLNAEFETNGWEGYASLSEVKTHSGKALTRIS